MLTRIAAYLRQHHIGLLALFIALGGTAYAATLAPDSVKSKHIVNGQVKEPDVGDDAIGSAEVIDESLVGANIQEDTLAEVPSASSAQTASSASNADNADTLDGRDSGDFVVPGSEAWKPLALQSNPTSCHYDNYGGGFNPAGYFRDRAGVVHLRGMVRAVDGAFVPCGFSGSDALVGTLPLGYRPANFELFTISSNNKPARIDMRNGSLELSLPVYPNWADAHAWFSLDGISWRCAPSGQDGCP